MNNFKLEHFKAFGNESFEVDLSRTAPNRPKHLLVYGANGSGKSSIQEGLRYAFFRQKDEQFEKVNSMLPQAEKEQIIQDKRNQYRNQLSQTPFQIMVDNIDILDAAFDTSKYNAFFIYHSKLVVRDELYLQSLLESVNYNRSSIDTFLSEWGDTIKDHVNDILAKKFFTPIEISLNPAEKWKCTFKDKEHNITSSKKLYEDFNEANLNLCCLLLLIESISLLIQNDKDNILVLDDFVTSLDASNRITVTKYLLDTITTSFQLIVLTHNVNFYNLFSHAINNYKNCSSEWEFINLIHVEGKHCYYRIGDVNNVAAIRKEYNDDKNKPIDYESYGNKIRQCFEANLHEFMSLVMVGANEDAKAFLDFLAVNDFIYFRKGSNLQKLVERIDRKVEGCPLPSLRLKIDIKKMIQEYKSHQTKDLIFAIRELRLYQKVMMHPMSHGNPGLTAWSDNEVKRSLDLLEVLEKAIKNINNGRF